MRSLSAASALFLLSFTVSFSAKAVTVSNLELPATIQSCISAGSCVVNNSSSYQSASVSAFQIFETSGYQQSWLMRYDLVSPSGQIVIEGGPDTTYSGQLWMKVANSYSATDTSHAITLFMDRVTPAPTPMYNQSGDLSLLMTTADLLAGSAYHTTNYVDYEENGIVGAGELSGEIPIICLAAGCQISAQLNLVQLNYQNFGEGGIYMTGFDPLDMRGLVYSQSSAYFDGKPPYGSTQSFYVTAVPEPEASWLLGFGLMAVFTVAKRRSLFLMRS